MSDEELLPFDAGEFTLCNRCTFERVKARAARKGQVVTIVPNKELGLLSADAVDVFVHPADYDIARLEDRAERGRHWVCWLMKVTEKCEC